MPESEVRSVEVFCKKEKGHQNRAPSLCVRNPHIQESPHPRAPESPKSLKKDFPGLPVKKVSKKSPNTDFVVFLALFRVIWHFFDTFLTLQAGRPGNTILRLFGDFGPRGPRDSCIWRLQSQPNPQYFSKSTAVQMGGRTAVQMGGVLQYKWEAYCGVSLSSKLRSQESTAIQMGGVLPYKLEVYCRTFQTSCRGWGFRNIAQRKYRETSLINVMSSSQGKTKGQQLKGKIIS